MQASANSPRDSVIERFYSAAVGLKPWDDALAHLSQYLDAKASYINVLSEPKRTLCLVGAYGHAPRLIERYHTYGYLIDPTTSHILANAGQSVQFSDLLHREFGGPVFHREFIASRGTDHVLAIGLESEVGTLLVKLSRDATGQPFTQGAAERLEGIAHHMRQAVVIDRSLRQRMETDTFATEIVNRLRAAVIGLEDGMRVSFANQSARRLAAQGDVFTIEDGRLRFAGSAAMAAFQAFVRKFASADGDAPRTIVLTDGDDGRRARIWAWPLRQPFSHELGLMILPDGFDADVLDAMLQQNYGLTPSEVRTVVGVLTHNGLAAVAEHSGVSLETVRFHLKRIFSKTGTCRQSELVRVIANDLCCIDVETRGPRTRPG
jgi:DNA-binding CsgD family transcriptional regulator